MRRFAYERPTSLSEATGLVASIGDGARLLAGGTDLIVGLRDGTIQPSSVVDVKWIAEFGDAPIVSDGESMCFGALATMGQIERDPWVLEHLPALAEAARVVGSVQIRNRATLTGNICNGSPAADTAPPLLVYGAIVHVAGPDGERSLPIDDFILGPRRVDLGPGELVTAIEVPMPAAETGAAYTRLVRRWGTDLASVTMCVSVDEAGRTRVSYGSVGPRAFLVVDDTGVLADTSANGTDRSAILERLLDQATPSPRSIRAGPDYRLAMLRVLAMRALGTALERRSGRAA